MKNIYWTLIISGLIALAATEFSFAEDIALDKIVVTASRSDESQDGVSREVDIITGEEIEKSQAEDLSELISGITSVNISNYGGMGATKNIRMRGSTAAQVLVLIDGRPLNSPRDGEVDLSNIPLDNIARVEIMHGPGSSLYGSSAMGGVVNIITKEPPLEGREGSFTTSFGTFRTYMEKFSFGAGDKNLGLLLSGSYQGSRGFRANSDFEGEYLNAKFVYQAGEDNKLTLNTGWLKNRSGTPGSITAVDLDDRQRVAKNFYDLNWDLKTSEGFGVKARVFQNYDRLEFIENTAGSIFDTANSHAVHTTKVRGGGLQLNRSFSDNYEAIAGFDYTNNLNNSTASAKHQYLVRAGYLENRLDLSDTLHLSLNARVDDYSNFGAEVSPSFDFLYRMSEKIRLHGLISRSFRAPTFNDLYWPDEGWARGNPDLSPEKGMTYELGVEANVVKGLTTDLVYYRSDFKDLINWSEESGVWTPKNVNSALIHGVEFKNKIALMAELELDLNYTLLIAKDKETHKYLIYQPKDKVDFVLAHHNLMGMRLELNGEFTSRRYHDAQNNTVVKSFYVLNFDVSKKFNEMLTGYVSIDNLLNYKYQVIKDYPMPGFAITGGMKLEF
ncbi:MAG: TonB-dependent receptor plug domain-containing protein [Candidatus Omnitrophota bacterium]